MAIRRLCDSSGIKTYISGQLANLGQAQGGTERLGVHLLLVSIGVAGIKLHQVLQLLVVVRPQQVADKKGAPLP